MYKSFLILTFLVLFGSYSQHVPGQTTTDKRLSGINVKDPKNPTDSFATVVSATQASNAEAMELYREGTKLTEAGQFSQAVEKFQQALKLDPEFAEAYSGLGRAQFKMRQWQESAVNFRRAIALRTKQQALQDAPHQKDATRESNEVRPQVTSAPASTPNKQEPNANVATVKSQRPELTQRPRHASDISTPAQRMPTTAQTKLPSDSNRNDVGVKRPNPESQTTRQSAQHNEVTAPAEAITKSPQVTLPQGNGNNAAGVKLASNSQTTRPLQQRNEVSISSQPVPTSSHVTQQTNTANVDVKLRNPEPQMTRQPPPHDAVSAPHAIPKSPQVRLPQGHDRIAGLELPLPELQTTGQPQQRNEVSISSQPVPANSLLTLFEGQYGKAVGVNPATPESKTIPASQQHETSISAQAIPNSHVTLPRENSSNDVRVNPPIPESKTMREQQTQNETSIAAEAIPPSQVMLPRENSGNVVVVNLPIPESETTRQPQQRTETSIPAQVVASSRVTLPQENSSNAVRLNPPIPESETTREPKPTADGGASPESNGKAASDDKRDSESVSVSMTVSPTPVAATKNAPVSTATSNDETSLTRIYRIGPSDVLDVRINDSQPTKSTLFTVTPSGSLEHPMLPEPLQVSGLTEEEIRTKIENELSKRALLDNPKVTVGVREYASHTILVSGLVNDPGTKVLIREAIPLFVVVADAQPLPEASRVSVRRTEPNQMYEMDLNRAADMELLIHPGDVITLSPSVKQFVYIGGEVKLPGEKTFRDGLTLTQAIISAGGPTPKSKVAEIGREDDHGFLVPTRFNLKDIQSGKSMNPSLKPGDRITILN